MELGAAVELGTAAVPHLFLPLACAANVVKVFIVTNTRIFSLMMFNLLFCFITECCSSNINVYSYPHL